MEGRSEAGRGEDTAASAPPANPSLGALDRLGRRPCRAFLLIFALSLTVQGFFLSKMPPRAVEPNTRWELPSIAVALAERGAFADPFALPTGPTAHLPPLSPALFGLAYNVLGLNATAGYVAWSVTLAFAAAAWALLPWLAGWAGLSPGAGVLAGVVGGVIPRWSGHGESMASLALVLLTVAFLRRWMAGRRPGSGAAFLLGVASGVAFHAQPALLPVVLGWMAFELWWRKDRRKWFHSGLMVLGMVVACIPWGWRNYRTFDAVFFIRSNLGLELRMGNHEGAAAAMDVMDREGEHLHPRALESEARKVQELGEVPYMREAGREALDWMEANPGAFLKLTASRAVHWWLGPLYYPPGALLVTVLTLLAGLGIWHFFPALAAPERAALLIPLLTFPLIYYLVAYMPRYREPIDWLFLLLAAAALWRPQTPTPPPGSAPGPPGSPGGPGPAWQG